MQPKYLRRRKVPFRLACSILLCPEPAPDRTLQLRQVLPSSDVPLIQRFKHSMQKNIYEGGETNQGRQFREQHLKTAYTAEAKIDINMIEEMFVKGRLMLLPKLHYTFF